MVRQRSIEDKHRIIDLYRSGYGSTIICRELSISESQVKIIINRYLRYGDQGLERLPSRIFTAAFKREVVNCVLKESLSLEQVSLRYQIGASTVHTWVKLVESHGYERLSDLKPRGRPPKDMGRPKKKEPQTELEKLRERVAYLETENALLKKVRALVEERIARESGKKPRPSKN